MTKPMRYRKKLVVIEAMEWVGDGACEDDEVIDWIFSHDDSADVGGVRHDDGWHLMIRTLEGEMEAQIGDFIIKEPFRTADRIFYPCKRSIFEQTYEIASGPSMKHGYVGVNEYLDNVWGFWFGGSLFESFTSTREINDFEKCAIKYFVDTCLEEDQPWSLDAPTDLALGFWVSEGAFSKSGR